MRIENGIAFVENPLLCAAIWGDTNCIYNGKPKFTGYLNANADRIGRAFIEYCIARVMKIFRLPMCGYDSYSEGACMYNELDEEMVTDACDELSAIIKHVQESLSQLKIVHDGKVEVVRCLSKFQYDEVAKQLEDQSIDEIVYPVSIFSSYSYDGDINQNYPSGRVDSYKNHINIKENISVKDIIFWDKFVGNGCKECNYVQALYNGEMELWVVDKSVTGMRRLPRSCFYFNGQIADGFQSKINSSIKNEKDNDKASYSGANKKEIDKALYSGAHKKRPCEYDDCLTRYCMKRNLRKIKDGEAKTMKLLY